MFIWFLKRCLYNSLIGAITTRSAWTLVWRHLAWTSRIINTSNATCRRFRSPPAPVIALCFASLLTSVTVSSRLYFSTVYDRSLRWTTLTQGNKPLNECMLERPKCVQERNSHPQCAWVRGIQSYHCVTLSGNQVILAKEFVPSTYMCDASVPVYVRARARIYMCMVLWLCICEMRVNWQSC